VVVALLLFALVAGWLFQRNVESERARFEASQGDRLAALAELLHTALPSADAPVQEQAEALLDWSARLRLPMALEDAQGVRIATSPAFARLMGEALEAPADGPPHGEPGAPGEPARPGADANFSAGHSDVDAPPPGSRERRAAQRVALADGRVLMLMRGPPRVGPRGPEGRRMVPEPPPFVRGIGLVVTLGVLFLAVAAGAFPVVRRLTRRLEALKQGVETFGAGALDHRVDASGRDEVAAVAASFNAAATRVESLVVANRSLLANASHELRSPLARLKMAVAMLEGAAPERRPALRQEIERNIAELDSLVEEVLLASRLDARQGSAAQPVARDPVDLLALVAEEAARVDAVLDLPADAPAGTAATGLPATLPGEERLLRRALRNLLENARRYGGSGAPTVQLQRHGPRVELCVCDRGPGVPEALRERIFEPFYRLPGHAEQAGGVGLGLSLVRQIARHHGGEVHCEAREGGGSCFVLALPAS
jgi:signal transduction histidine kinase